MNPVLISQLVDKVEEYSDSLILQKPQSRQNVRIIWLEKTLFALQAQYMGDAKFQTVIAEMHKAASEALEAQEAKNEGQVRLKAYN